MVSGISSVLDPSVRYLVNVCRRSRDALGVISICVSRKSNFSRCYVIPEPSHAGNFSKAFPADFLAGGRYVAQYFFATMSSRRQSDHYVYPRNSLALVLWASGHRGAAVRVIGAGASPGASGHRLPLADLAPAG